VACLSIVWWKSWTMRLPKKKWKLPEPKRLNAEWMTFAPDKRKTIPDEQVLGRLIGAWRPAQRFLWSDDPRESKAFY
jgi:hypothetical protein